MTANRHQCEHCDSTDAVYGMDVYSLGTDAEGN